MSGGEFMRAVLADRAITSKQRWYTIEVPMTSSIGVKQAVHAVWQFEQGEWYLLTNVLIFYAVSPVTGGGSFSVSTVKPNYDIQIYRQRNRKTIYSSSAANPSCQLPQTINQQSDWTEYEAFEPAEQIGFTVIPQVSQEQTVYFTLQGIQYKEND